MKHLFGNEANVYLWYIHATKKFYLGKTNGNDPYYTHSAQSSEEFRSIVPYSNRPISERKEFLENIPKGISRKKIAYGTDEEMCILEHELLVNRKKRCWDRYYNESLGDPRYVDQSGENNPSYTNGSCVGYHDNPEVRKQYLLEYYKINIDMWKERQKMPERKAWQKEYDKKRKNCPKRKAWRKKYTAKKKTERQGEGTLEGFLG